jgi:hypothetical protein
MAILELPYTLPQDFTLFVILKEKNIDIWKQKLDWIAARGGMAMLNTHPDYMNFNDKKLRLGEYSAKYYADFLEYASNKYKSQIWHSLPKDLIRFYDSKIYLEINP